MAQVVSATPPPPASQPPDPSTTTPAPPAATQKSTNATERKSFVIPALDILLFEGSLNAVDRQLYKGPIYDTTLTSIDHNLHTKWVIDTDPFATNQFLHPYQGAMYHDFARSAGLGYWQSAAYAFGGSLLWEIAGETTSPSKNDQVASGIGGSLFGEPLFRMAHMVLNSGNSTPFWRELAAAAISPALGFNRAAFGDRFDHVFSSHDAAVFVRAEIGASSNRLTASDAISSFKQRDAVADFTMEYGRPGQPGYTYDRPFDYFTFQATASRDTVLETVTTRGVLVGREYDRGDGYRSVWGLYGSYDYVSPQVFRVSSTAASLGTTAQWKLSRAVAVQGTMLVGLGYGAAGATQPVGERDYHYGLTPQVLLAPRLIFGHRAALDLSARDFYVSRIAGTQDDGRENIARAEGTLTMRVAAVQAISVRYVYSRRDGLYPGVSNKTQLQGTYSILYTILSDRGFGVVHW